MPHHIHRAATKTRIDAAPNEIERHMDDAHEFVTCVKPASIVRHRISLSQSPQGNHFFRLELTRSIMFFQLGLKNQKVENIIHRVAYSVNKIPYSVNNHFPPKVKTVGKKHLLM